MGAVGWARMPNTKSLTVEDQRSSRSRAWWRAEHTSTNSSRGGLDKYISATRVLGMGRGGVRRMRCYGRPDSSARPMMRALSGLTNAIRTPGVISLSSGIDLTMSELAARIGVERTTRATGDEARRTGLLCRSWRCRRAVLQRIERPRRAAQHCKGGAMARVQAEVTASVGDGHGCDAIANLDY